MKRHAKPFHCTSDGCRKSFGSKNDWKRHENSQHFQLEVWRCDQRSKTAGSMLCSKVCHRRESFRTHLRDHGITDGAVIDDKLDKCRVGRSCEQRFWCGFCKKVIDIREKGLGAWTTRFDHICNHFNQGCIKEDWQPFDERYDARQASAVDDRASASSPSTTSLSSLFAPSSPEPASPMSLDTNRKRTRSPSADEDTEALQPSKKLRTKKTEYRVTCVGISLLHLRQIFY